MTYYYIEKYGMLARGENEFDYDIYDAERGWISDEWSIISDYLIGFDSSEEPDSPYRIGSLSVMDEIKEIAEEQAEEIMKDYEFLLGDNPRRWNP